MPDHNRNHTEITNHEDRRQRAFGRTPVGMTKNVWPIVACRDGSVWELTSLPVDGQPDGQRLDTWRQLPPIPGSVADLNHDYWLEGGDR
jgi:hypothetical protein